MTFPDPVGWPDTPARPRDESLVGRSVPADTSFELPPLPTLSPLPVVKPLDPMPRPPWETEHTAPGTASGTASAGSAPGSGARLPPPPPSGHPAADDGRPTWTAPAAWPTAHTGFSAGLNPATDVTGRNPDDAEPAPTPVPAPAPTPTPAPEMSPADESTAFNTVIPAASRGVSGRHAGADIATTSEPLPLAPGLRVFMVGGSEPLGRMIAERLILAGHRLAAQGVTLPTGMVPTTDTPTFRLAEPLALPGDRADAEEIVHSVARAEVALGGLDAVVVLPAQQATGITLDADAATWADEWSLALTTDVLAAACATHIAARSFLARRRAGRVILVTNGRDGALSSALPTSATSAALSRLGADLTRELGPHGIGVSVVTTGPGGAQDFAMTQVVDVVEALLSTPVLTGVTSRIG